MMTLARWRWRESWLLLLITAMGIIAAVMIVCMAPLLTEVTTTAALRSVLRVAPDSSEITMHTTTAAISTNNISTIHTQTDGLFHHYLKPYVTDSSQFTIQTSAAFTLPQADKSQRPLLLFGTSLQQAAQHITLIKGRLPQEASQNQNVEVAMTPDVASVLHVTVNSIITAQMPFYTQLPDPNVRPILINQQFHVVGLIKLGENDPFWHGNALEVGKPGDPLPMLLSSTALLHLFDHLAATQPGGKPAFLAQVPDLYLYYHLNPSHIASRQLDDLIKSLNGLQTHVADNLSNAITMQDHYPYYQHVDLYGRMLHSDVSPDTLSSLSSRIALMRIPTNVILLQIFALLLFFVSMMTSLLVEHQENAIVILRSRGASRRQIFGALLTQCSSLALLALCIGPLLSLFAVTILVHWLLLPADLDALRVISQHPIQAMLDVKWNAIFTVVIVISAMATSVYHATSADVLTTRRESARETRRPLWQRLNLDIVAALVALAGYRLSFYVSGNLLSTQATTLIASPLSLIAPIFLLLGLLLLVLRLFPLFLRLGAGLTARSRGATAMLAFVQMARSPRRAIRMSLLLALSIAFAIFTLTFSASQAQHAQNVTAYQAGADFSGTIPEYVLSQPQTEITKTYRTIPGVISASVGYNSRAFSQGAEPTIPVDTRVVDTQTFAQTAIWNEQDSSQSLTSLMQQLIARRDAVTTLHAVPAIVDAAAYNRLRLHVGQTFSVKENDAQQNTVAYLVIAQVQHIPTINDSLEAGSQDNYIAPGGVIADYQSYVSYQKRVAGVTIQANQVWLLTRDNTFSVSSVRQALTTYPLRLENLLDRHAQLEVFHGDPLSLTLQGLLLLGGFTALLLAIVGSLFASWLNARTRISNFVVLRALGSAPRQVASMLTWEQTILYSAALLMGLGFGLLFSLTTVPNLVFTTLPTNASTDLTTGAEFYALQHVLPVQVTLPLSLGIVLVVLIALFTMALVMMAQVVLRASMNQILRLNED